MGDLRLKTEHFYLYFHLQIALDLPISSLLKLRLIWSFMISLETRLSLDNFLPLDQTSWLLGQAEVRITFWGRRVVEIVGFEGSVSLEDIVDNIFAAAKDSLSDEDKRAGQALIKQAQKLYEESDRLIEDACFLTRFFIWIRELRDTHSICPRRRYLQGQVENLKDVPKLPYYTLSLSVS